MTDKKPKGKYEDKLFLDMPFEEALERFAGVDPQEMRANIDKAKKRRPPGRKQSGGQSDDGSVVSLSDRRRRNQR